MLVLANALIAVVLPAAAQEFTAKPIPWTEGREDQDFGEVARTASLPVVVFFTAEGNPRCRQMQEEVLASPEVSSVADKFTWIRVDVTKPDAFESARRHSGLLAVPGVQVYGFSGRKVGEILSSSKSVCGVQIRELRTRAVVRGNEPSGPGTDGTHRLNLRNGNTIDGKLRELADDLITFEYEPNAIITFRREDVLSVEWVVIRSRGEGSDRVDLKPVATATPTETPNPTPTVAPSVSPTPAGSTEAERQYRQLVQKLLQSKDGDAFVQGLMKAGSPVLVAAMAAINETEEISMLTFNALEMNQDRTAAQALRGPFRAATRPAIIASIIRAFIVFDDLKVIGDVKERLAHEDPDVRRAAIQYLAKNGDATVLREMARAVVDTDADIRPSAQAAALMILKRHDEYASFLSYLSDQLNGQPESRFDKVPELVQSTMRREGVEALVKCLRMQTPEIRGGAAAALGVLNFREDSEGPLLDAMAVEADPGAMSKICNGIAQLKIAKAVRPLVELLKDHESDAIGASIVGALCQLTNQSFPSSYEAWKAHLDQNKDRYPEVAAEPGPVRYRDRATGRVLEERIVGEGALRFLHVDPRGRKLTDLALRFAAPSILYGLFQRMARSRKAIPEFIRATGLDAGEAEKPPGDYRSLDDFFTRRLKPGLRPIDPRADRLIAPADGRVLVYPEIGDGELDVKGSRVTLRALLGDSALAKRYEGGSAIVVRLAPPDYHRFHFPETGRAGRARKIGWHLYSVSPIALAAGAPSFKNKRQLTVLRGDRFGDLLLIEIGAIGVGRIVQTYRPGPVQRGQEKGLFRFGGSTTMIVAGPGRVRWDDDLVEASRQGLETLVRMGTAIGRA